MTCAIVALLGCRDDDDPFVPESVYGSYALEARNGQGLPVNVAITTDDGATVTSIIGGGVFFDLQRDHTTDLVVRGRQTGSTTETVFSISLGEGPSIFNGRTVTLSSFSGGDSYIGSFGGAGGKTLTVNAGEPWGTLTFRQPQ